MGVYLSAPVTEKVSADEKCSGFVYGASSMQGWRITQEDAHNCIPEFDAKTNTSFFAVYDGHGGSEVAKYCERHFPDFVTEMIKSPKAPPELTDLIKTAFLAFDATLTNEEVIKELKELAGKDDDLEEEEENDPVGRTETDRLKEEANMPLDQVLAQYKSPALRGKKGADGGESSQAALNGIQQPPASSSGLQQSSSSSSSSSGADSAASSSSSSAQQSNASVPNGKSGDTTTSSASQKVEEPAGSANNNNNNLDKGEGSSGKKDVEEETAGGSEASAAAAKSVSPDDVGGSRDSKRRAVAGMALQAGSSDEDSTEDEDEEGEKDYELMWEDTSDDEEEEDEEEENDEEVPMMDMTNEEPGSDSGCTACVLLMQGKKLIVANSGDSRCVLSRGGTAVELSFDHKPEDQIERDRIEKAGGKVTADGRVNGGLNLSRAIGDHVYKRNAELPAKDQMITALPDIETAELCDKDQFLVIACDGIWNSLSSQEVVDFVTERLEEPEKRNKPSLICEELFDKCLAPDNYGDGTGCDNMTCIIIVLNSAAAKAKGEEVTEGAADSTQKDLPEEDSSEPSAGGGGSDANHVTGSSLKRCGDQVEAVEGKRAKVGEEVV